MKYALFFRKTFKIGLWALIPLFLISNAKIDGRASDIVFSNGNYNLRVSGVLNQEFEGEVNFETSIKTDGDGIPFSTLKLRLANTKENDYHAMEFLISRQNQPNEIGVGTYKITRDTDGFLNYFDGVFGFANIQMLGELPFFAQKGNIVIKSIDDTVLRGTIKVTLSNPDGRSIDLIGDFMAMR